MLFHSGLSPSASCRTVSTIRYMMFSSTLRKAAGQANHQRLGRVMEAPSAPEALEHAGSAHTTASLHATPPHQGISAQARGKKVSISPSGGKKKLLSYTAITPLSSHRPAVQAEHEGHLWAEQTQVHLRMLTAPGQNLGQPWDSPRRCWPGSAHRINQQTWGPAPRPRSIPLLPSPAPYLRSVLSAREMAGFLTALLQAALLLRGENSLRGVAGDV